MGSQYQAKCRSCGHEFTVQDGGGFFFHLLHCDKCGRAKSISFEELGEIHLLHLKAFPESYHSRDYQRDRLLAEKLEGKPLSEKEYQKAVEAKAGHCRCRGKYTFDAEPRCPKCRSLDFEPGEGGIDYD